MCPCCTTSLLPLQGEGRLYSLTSTCLASSPPHQASQVPQGLPLAQLEPPKHPDSEASPTPSYSFSLREPPVITPCPEEQNLGLQLQQHGFCPPGPSRSFTSSCFLCHLNRAGPYSISSMWGRMWRGLPQVFMVPWSLLPCIQQRHDPWGAKTGSRTKRWRFNLCPQTAEAWGKPPTLCRGPWI